MATLSTIQKQILLAKLNHEYETAPDFGTEHISDYRSPQLQWVSRVYALMTSVDFNAGVRFDLASQTMHHQYGWTTGVREAFMEVLKVIGTLKLGLELDGEDEIGKVYDSNKTYDFFVDLKAILNSAQSEIFIVDPYFNGRAFEDFLAGVRPPVKIEILSKGPLADDVKPHADKHSQQFSTVTNIRKTKKTHDRVMFIDGSDGWIIGGSLNDGGKKPSYILPLHPALTPEKRKIYQSIWNKATVVI